MDLFLLHDVKCDLLKILHILELNTFYTVSLGRKYECSYLQEHAAVKIQCLVTL